MADQSIGTLLIELKAKTDQFEKGLKAAKDLSFQSAGDIKSSLSSIASQLERVSFKNVEQGTRSLGILGGVAVATGTALTSAIIATAVETSKSMVEMGHSAEKAGMGIKEFTEYAYAAKRAGVPIEEFTGSMSKLAKTALSAAEGSGQAQQALRLAGASATDANGKLRPTGDILADIIKKYEQTTDRTLKAGLAMQVFGRGGAAMIPFLNQGSKAIQELRKQAEQLGVAFDENTLRAAQQFRGEMVQMQAEAKGLATQFTAGLLPAVNQVFASFTTVYGGQSAAREFGETVGEAFRSIAKAIYDAAFALEYWRIKKDQVEHSRLGQIASGVMKMGHGGKGLGEGMADVLSGVLGSQKDNTEELIAAAQKKRDDRINALYAKPKPVSDSDGRAHLGTSGLGKGQFAKDVSEDEIAKLREKAKATSLMAAAQLQGEDAVRKATAANAADAVILQMATKATRDREAEAKRLGKGFDYAAELKKQVAAEQKKHGAIVLGLETDIEANERAEQFNKTLREQTQEATISSNAHRAMAAAILQGGSAIQEAAIANEIEALQAKYATAATDEQRDAIKKLIAAKREEAAASVTEEFNRETVSRTACAHATKLLTEAIGKGVDAEIQARATIEAENWALRQNIDLQDERVEKMRESIAANLRAEQQRGAIEGIRSEYNPQDAHKQRLQDIYAAEEAGKISPDQATLAVAEADRKLLEDQDNLLARTRTTSGGIRAFFNEYATSATNAAERAHDAMAQLFDGLQTSMSRGFADMLKGTKTIGQAFGEMGRNILSTIAETIAQYVSKWIMAHLAVLASKVATNQAGVASDQMAAAQSEGIGIKSALKSIMRAAKVAAAHAFKAVMEHVPFPFNLALAPLAAVGAFAGAMAWAAFADGGRVRGAGSGTSDSIPAMLSNGEHVMTAHASSVLGHDTFDMLNRNPERFSRLLHNGGAMFANFTMKAMPMVSMPKIALASGGAVSGDTHTHFWNVSINEAKGQSSYTEMRKAAQRFFSSDGVK